MANRSGWWLFCAFHIWVSILLYGQTEPVATGHVSTSKERADAIITGGSVVTMDGQRHIYDDGAVVVTGDAIVAVGPRTELEARYDSSQKIDAKGKLVIP